MLRTQRHNKLKIKTISSIKSTASKNKNPVILKISQKSTQNQRLSSSSKLRKSTISNKSYKSKKKLESKQEQNLNLLSVNKFLYQQLERQNEEIRNQIMENKNDRIKTKENILQLVKTMTLKKLNLTENHNRSNQNSQRKQEEKCNHQCRKQMQKQLLTLKLKRYQLEKERNDFLKWEESKLREHNHLKEMIKQIDRNPEPIFI